MKTPFEQALLDSLLSEFSDIPDAEDKIDLTFSTAFIRKSEKLVQNTQRKAWHYVNTGSKRAILVAVIAAILTTTAFAIPDVRKTIIAFFARDEGTHYTFTFDAEQSANAPKRIESAYYPTNLPVGYELLFKTTNIAAVSVAWMNPDGLTISYRQQTIPEDPENKGRGNINAEGTTLTNLNLDGYEIIRGEDDVAIYYVWTNHEYLFTLICDKVIAEEEIVKVFKSVQVDPNAVIDGAE